MLVIKKKQNYKSFLNKRSIVTGLSILTLPTYFTSVLGSFRREVTMIHHFTFHPSMLYFCLLPSLKNPKTKTDVTWGIQTLQTVWSRRGPQPWPLSVDNRNRSVSPLFGCLINCESPFYPISRSFPIVLHYSNYYCHYQDLKLTHPTNLNFILSFSPLSFLSVTNPLHYCHQITESITDL